MMEVDDLNVLQVNVLMENHNEEPVVFMNLLKFKVEGGLASYARYAMEADKYLRAVGGKAIFMGQPKELLIGHETWDALILVRYPSRKAYMSMIDNPGYQDVHKYRAAALDRSVLYAIDEMSPQKLLFGGK
jgi:uncharacterized protein (DUF1330 family)